MWSVDEVSGICSTSFPAMTQMPSQACKDTVITPHEKILPIVILLEAAMITVVHIMTDQKGTKINSKIPLPTSQKLKQWESLN